MLIEKAAQPGVAQHTSAISSAHVSAEVQVWVLSVKMMWSCDPMVLAPSLVAFEYELSLSPTPALQLAGTSQRGGEKANRSTPVVTG
jgi:hypothetical protein